MAPLRMISTSSPLRLTGSWPAVTFHGTVSYAQESQRPGGTVWVWWHSADFSYCSRALGTFLAAEEKAMGNPCRRCHFTHFSGLCQHPAQRAVMCQSIECWLTCQNHIAASRREKKSEEHTRPTKARARERTCFFVELTGTVTGLFQTT